MPTSPAFESASDASTTLTALQRERHSPDACSREIAVTM